VQCADVDNWTEMTGDALGQEVVKIGRALWDADYSRRSNMLANIRRYEGRKIPSLDSWERGPNQALDVEEILIRWNLCRTLTDTVTAKIAGSQQPKISFVASNADWSTRRKGPKLEACIAGSWACSQEPYSDIWDLGCAVFRDAAVCGLGAVKVWSDNDAGRVVHERTFPWQLLVDPRDAQYGRPTHLFQATSISRAALIALFPEKKKALKEFRASSELETTLAVANEYVFPSGSKPVSDLVPCFEWWSLPLSVDCPGKHVLAFAGGVLIEEPWERDTFPFACVRWSREFAGWHGHALIDDISEIDSEMNDVLARVVRTVRLTGMGTLYIHETDTVTAVDNQDATVVRWAGNVPPKFEQAAPISPAHLQLIQTLKASAYEFSGVNEMSATAQKQPGIESGSAIRMVADLQSERFALVWRSYQQMFVEVARHDVACYRELAQKDPTFSARWPGNGFLQTVPWEAVDLADDLYVIQIASAPSVKGTPADRLQTAEELFASGTLSKDALLAVRSYLDLPGELDRVSRQRNVIERYIESWLDATPEEIETMKKADGSPLVRPPLPFMRLEDALLQVVDAFLDAELNDAPDEIKDLFLRWIEMADSEIQKRAQRMAALSAPPPAPNAPGAMMPPTPPGAPMSPMGASL